MFYRWGVRLSFSDLDRQRWIEILNITRFTARWGGVSIVWLARLLRIVSLFSCRHGPKPEINKPVRIWNEGVRLYLYMYRHCIYYHRHYQIDTIWYNRCPHQPLQTMKKKPVVITLIPGQTNSGPHPNPSSTPLGKKMVKQNMDWYMALGIIEPVLVGMPTTWCFRMAVAPKKKGSYIRMIDLQKPDTATLRKTHHTSSPFNQASLVPVHTRKTVLDTWNSYYSLTLYPSAWDVTTLIAEWGRYHYHWVPQGFHALRDVYTCKFDDITIDMRINDTILCDDSIEISFWHTVDYIAHSSNNGVVFNP